jgi:hypothetical protein
MTGEGRGISEGDRGEYNKRIQQKNIVCKYEMSS